MPSGRRPWQTSKRRANTQQATWFSCSRPQKTVSHEEPIWTLNQLIFMSFVAYLTRQNVHHKSIQVVHPAFFQGLRLATCTCHVAQLKCWRQQICWKGAFAYGWMPNCFRPAGEIIKQLALIWVWDWNNPKSICVWNGTYILVFNVYFSICPTGKSLQTINIPKCCTNIFTYNSTCARKTICWILRMWT